MVCLISRDTFRYVVLDVVVEERVLNLIFACFLVWSERTLVLAGGCVGFIALPVDGIDADTARQYHNIVGVVGTLGVPTDDNACITRKP